MRLLLLYGVNCTKKIWNRFEPYLEKHEVTYVEYPHEMTQKAKTVEEISKWVYDTYQGKTYDVVIGHSLGGIIALQLVSKYKMKFQKIIYLDTNLKPANEFYRNLMTPEHMEQYGEEILPMFQEERKFYTPELFEQIQGEFDYTEELKEISQKVYAIYGDRNLPDYKEKVADLNLSEEALAKLELRFVSDACHMMMIENPKELNLILESILEEKDDCLNR